MVATAAAGLVLEHCSEEHNYSLSQGEELGPGPGHNSQTEGGRVGETQQEARGREESQANTELDPEDEEQEEDEEDEEEEEDAEEGAEETAAEAELSSSSETECGELCFKVCVCAARTSQLITALPAARLPTRKPSESVSGPDKTSDLVG